MKTHTETPHLERINDRANGVEKEDKGGKKRGRLIIDIKDELKIRVILRTLYLSKRKERKREREREEETV